MILLDTSVISSALRRRKRGEAEAAVSARVAGLLEGDRQVAIPGIVLQELLSGIADRGQYDRVLAGVRDSFPVVLAAEGDHLKAADLVNQAARAGFALTTPDALIAAQALNRRASLFTIDQDFAVLAKRAGLRLL